MNRFWTSALFLFLGFFALYALTAQRGLGWGDSGEFQYRILSLPWSAGLAAGTESFATSHPLYVLVGKLVAWSPYTVTLISSLFGALAVCGLYACTRRADLCVLFGLSHCFWWLSCVAEVYTMVTALLSFEVFFLLRFLRTGRRTDLAAMMFVNGINLCIHNVALLSLPVYGILLLSGWKRRNVLADIAVAAGAWAAGAVLWVYAFVTRGPADVLFGGYGGAALGFWSTNWKVTLFNYALVSISLVVPLLLVRWHFRARARACAPRVPRAVLALAAMHALFWVRYFNVSQFTFFLPTLFFVYLLLARLEIGRTRFRALLPMQVLLPVMAYLIASQVPVPAWYRNLHADRNEAAYFMLPWKCHDTSADRCAAQLSAPWNGYPFRHADIMNGAKK